MPRRATDPADALFRAFESVARPGPLDACQCCLSEDEEQAALEPVPLRDLSGRAIYDLACYLWHARPVRGPDRLAGVVHYFTPRLLVDACESDWTWPRFELLTRRIAIAGWAEWPAPQREAVLGFLHAAWTRALGNPYPGKPDIWILLSAIGELEPDISPYLAEWAGRLHEPAAAGQLRWLIGGAVQLGDNGWQRSETPYADGLDIRQVSAWLDGLWEPFVTAYLGTSSAETREILEDIEIFLFSYHSGDE